jgi:selenium-dependent xanthine dehydrogenase
LVKTTFQLNGQTADVETREGETLLQTLRERLGVRSTKDGCAPQGQCGSCLAIVGGKAITTCAMPTAKASGKDVLTLEGVSEEERQMLSEAYAAAGAVQCGFCTPGLVLRTKFLMDKHAGKAPPTRDEIMRAFDVHLCRCTGYTKVLDAVENIFSGFVPEKNPLEGVGSRLKLYRAHSLALGDEPYVADMQREGLLQGAVVLSEHPRARVVAIDTTRASALPGVEKVITAADVPGERWYGLIQLDWPGFVAVGEEVRCVGDVLAAVAAVDEATAREAAALVDVTYEVLDPVLTPERSIEPGAPLVNPKQKNELSRTNILRGDVESALAGSAHVVEGTWKTQRIEHLYLETECALAEPKDGKLWLYTQGQGVFDDRRQVAAFLGVDEEQVEVVLVPNGGAFGGKEDMSIQAHTSLLAKLTDRPVMLRLNREESIRLHPKRHPITMHYKVGCDEEGRLTAVQAHMLGDTGAYASVGAKVLERAAGHACGPYRVLNVEVEAICAMTNNPPCGAMRGFGANQAHFAMEGCIDQLALKVGLDGWEFRWRNAVEVGDTFASGQVFEKSIGVKKTLQAVKDSYYAAREAGHAVGIACGIKNSGIGNGAVEWGKARLVIEKGGKEIGLYNGYTEMGQGLLTVLIQFAVEVTGLSASLFRPRVDSKFALGCGQTTGSRATLFGGNAVKSASEKLKAALDSGKTLEQMDGEIFAADVVVDDTTAPGAKVDKVKTHTSFGFATQVCILDEKGHIERFIAAHDVGRAVNPTLCEGQIQGSIHMGLGYALTESLDCENGWPVSYKLRDLGVLRARDMPEVEVILVEEPEPEGPFGAKGVGEIGLVPTAAAVASALAAFDGVQRKTLPMKDSPAGMAMSVGKKAKRS